MRRLVVLGTLLVLVGCGGEDPGTRPVTTSETPSETQPTTAPPTPTDTGPVGVELSLAQSTCENYGPAVSELSEMYNGLSDGTGPPVFLMELIVDEALESIEPLAEAAPEYLALGMTQVVQSVQVFKGELAAHTTGEMLDVRTELRAFEQADEAVNDLCADIDSPVVTAPPVSPSAT